MAKKRNPTKQRKPILAKRTVMAQQVVNDAANEGVNVLCFYRSMPRGLRIIYT